MAGCCSIQGGGDSDQPDDNDWKNHRPFFIDENTMTLTETENWLQQSLERIAYRLEQPLSKQEIEAQKQFLKDLEKTVSNKENNKQTLMVQVEVTDDTIRYKCPFCLEFVKWDEENKKVDKCETCFHRYCHECIKEYEYKCGICCTKTMRQDALVEVNSIKWQCQKCKREDITIPDMVAHITHCNSDVECEFDGCDFSGSPHDFEVHQLNCYYRPVKIGRFEFPAYQSEFIESYARELHEEDIRPGNLTPEIAVALLFSKIQNEASSEVGVGDNRSNLQNCRACKEVFTQDQIRSHELGCVFVHEDCSKCGLLVARKNMKNHFQSECDENYEACDCHENLLVKHMNTHQSFKCPLRKIKCRNSYRYFSCHQMISQCNQSSHNADECEFRTVKCPRCEVTLGPEPILREAHLEYCSETRVFFDKSFRRRETVHPVLAYGDYEFMVLLVAGSDWYEYYPTNSKDPVGMQVYRTNGQGSLIVKIFINDAQFELLDEEGEVLGGFFKCSSDKNWQYWKTYYNGILKTGFWLHVQLLSKTH